MSRSSHLASFLFLAISFLGLIVIAVLANSPTAIQGDVSWRKTFVGTVFSIVCILGILAGIFPSKCSKMFHFKKPQQTTPSPISKEKLPKEKLTLRGHHPDCGHFAAHVVRVEEKLLCAGCVGLILGAILSLFGVGLVFFANLPALEDYTFILWAGFAGVSCGLLQYHLFNWGRSSVHLAVNAFFVFGVFLLLVGVDGVAKNIIADFYLISLSVFWIYTRILLSQMDHHRICTTCPSKCEFHSTKKRG